MDKILTAGETLSILEQLRKKVEELSDREKVLVETRDRDLVIMQKKHDALKSRTLKDAATEAEQAKERLDAERKRLEGRFDARRERIDQAMKRATSALNDSAEQTRSQRKYVNQKELLQANREQEADMQALDQSHQAFLSELSLEVQGLDETKHVGWQVFRGYRTFRKWFQTESRSNESVVGGEGASDILETLRSHNAQLASQLRFSAQDALARLFSMFPIWVMLVLVGAAAATVYFVPQVSTTAGISVDQLLGWIGGLAGAVVIAYVLGFLMARSRVKSIIELSLQATDLIQQCQCAADHSREERVQAIQQKLQTTQDQLESALHDVDAKVSKELEAGLSKLNSQHVRLKQRLEQMAEKAMTGLKASSLNPHAGSEDGNSGNLEQLEAEHASNKSDVMQRFDQGMTEVLADWNAHVPSWITQLKANQTAVSAIKQPWNAETLQDWEAPTSGDPFGSFAELDLELKSFIPSSPSDSRMNLEVDGPLRVPLVFQMPRGESILLESDGPAPEEMVEAINGMILRLLMNTPVGRLRFTLVDPVGLGQNFAGLMHLADHDDQMINRKIWTQGSQIEQCLKDLTEHMEKVTQMYLRNEYETLAEYNTAAGNIAEKYHLLVVSDFPVGFTESALKRLQSIAVSGARCGVFLILHRDVRQVLPDDTVMDDLREHSVWIESKSRGNRLGAHRWNGVQINWCEKPDAQGSIDFIHQVGRASIDSNRVEVPFSHVMPKPEERWSLDTSQVLRVPIGRTGASKLQYLQLGKGTQQHALIAGKTGSGKSTLFHVMVTNLALWCRPDQVEFYLIDFKKGVEFKCYATHQLPHARVVAIESDREFGLSVLERVDQELRRRGDLFRQHGVQDLAAYQKVANDQPMPRTLVLIDEFQEYFVEDDRVAQNAAVLLDRIVRQGRAFGIHVILGSQTLGGAFTLARTTFAQMVVRIALQCDEADSYLIMDESNAAPRLLSRPGEGIYNDSSGAVEGNSPFQTVWLTDDERDGYLQTVNDLVHENQWNGPGPVVFEGNAPADIRENHELVTTLKANPTESPDTPHAWLGTPNSIKGPTCATFGVQHGNHLLVLGQNEEMAFSLVISSLISLSAQYPQDTAHFVIIDALADHSPQREMLDQVLSMLPQSVSTLRDANLEELMLSLDKGIESSSSEGKHSKDTFVVVLGLQLFKKLRPEDEFSFSTSDDDQGAKPGEVFNRLILEGPGAGMHVLATVDSYNSSQRFLSRKALAEFEMRVLFQMSANDSAALVDNTKASQLGLYRALFYNERKGYLETFRPYALPDGGWLAECRDLFDKRGSNVTT